VNVPNALTVVRILLVPALVLALLAKTGAGDLLAAAAFVAASATDALDGYLARRGDIVTTFGKIMDPIADKLLIIAALLALVSLSRVQAWVALVIIGREFAVTALRAAVGAGQGIVISANQLGKLKTVFQVALVLVLIIEHRLLGVRMMVPWWVYVIEYATVAITLASGAEYFRAALSGGDGGGGVEPRAPAGVDG
jgi:CDP-diacylglycerol---glycerol-3-phosphate 3-phosphatidyltransferase